MAAVAEYAMREEGKLRAVDEARRHRKKDNMADRDGEIAKFSK